MSIINNKSYTYTTDLTNFTNTTVVPGATALTVSGGDFVVDGAVYAKHIYSSITSEPLAEYVAELIESAGLLQEGPVEINIGVYTGGRGTAALQEAVNRILEHRSLPVRIKVAGFYRNPTCGEANIWSLNTTLRVRIRDVSLEDIVNGE